MSSGTSFSSGSFPPPGTGGNIPLSPLPTNAPAPAPTPAPAPAPSGGSFATTQGQVVSPIQNGVITGQMSPENMTQLIRDIPNFLKALPPDEQSKFLQMLMNSDILGKMFGALDDPHTRDSFKAVVRSLFDNGLLSQVAPDKAVLSEETQGALKDALQQKLVQTLVDVSKNLLPKTAEQPDSKQSTTTTPDSTTSNTNTANTSTPKPTNTATTTPQNITPQDAPEALVAATFATASEPEGQTLAKLNIPVSQPGTPNQMPESVASLVANTVTSALQQFMASGTTPASAANPQAAVNTPATQVATLLTSLIALGIQTTPGGSLQLAIPAKSDAAGFQTQVTQLTQQLNQISQQFSKLGEVATQDKWNIGALQNFVSVPANLLGMLKSIQPEDTTTTNMLKTWVDNSGIINAAILNKANETFRDKFEFLKTIVLSSFAATPAATLKEQQIRQQMFDHTLNQAPALLNVFKLKDMVGVFEEDIKRKHSSLLYTFKRMLFNAAHEVVIVAAGKPTFEYNDVGIFHEQLKFLAERIVHVLPKASDELDFDLMEVISNDITHTFKYIKDHEPYRMKDIFKRHPRTLLYLLCVDSPITEDVTFPRSESLGDTRDSTSLNMHFMRIMNVVKKFEKHSEFLKFQPKVLEAFIEEAKYDPTSDITKTSLNIVHKAVAECSGFIDLDSPD